MYLFFFPFTFNLQFFSNLKMFENKKFQNVISNLLCPADIYYVLMKSTDVNKSSNNRKSAQSYQFRIDTLFDHRCDKNN